MITYYTKEGKFKVGKTEAVPFSSLHRLNGPAFISKHIKIWYKNGKYHRENGPAIVWKDVDEEWRANGKKHRLDGPAVTWDNGKKEYWISGIRLDTKEVEVWIRNNNINLKTEVGQILFMLRFL